MRKCAYGFPHHQVHPCVFFCLLINCYKNFTSFISCTIWSAFECSLLSKLFCLLLSRFYCCSQKGALAFENKLMLTMQFFYSISDFDNFIQGLCQTAIETLS